MAGEVFDALIAQYEVVRSLVGGLGADDWRRDTRCPPWSVKELVTHMAQGMDVLLLDEIEPPRTKAPVIDLVGYWQRFDGDGNAARYVEAAQSQAAALEVDDLVARIEKKVDRTREHLAALSDDDLVGGSGVAIPAAELAKVYLIEAAVHALDVRRAIDADERLDEDAAPIVAGTFERILGAPARELTGWDDTTFVLTATGRRLMTDDERTALGEVAAALPLFR